MQQIELPYSEFKIVAAAKSMPIQYVMMLDTYYIHAFDGVFSIFCKLFKDPVSPSADIVDFEANIAPTANTPLLITDADGAQIVRIKAAKSGWAFRGLGVEFTTSLLDSLYCKDYEDNPITFVTAKYYNASNVEVTTPGLLGANLATIVKTVVDIEPNHDYEVIGGSLRLRDTISDDCRLWIVAAPDIPAAYGGSKEMVSGVNLRYISSTEAFLVDGRVTKFMTYNATTHQGKLRFILKHPAGLQATIMFVFDHYKG